MVSIAELWNSFTYTTNGFRFPVETVDGFRFRVIFSGFVFGFNFGISFWDFVYAWKSCDWIVQWPFKQTQCASNWTSYASVFRLFWILYASVFRYACYANNDRNYKQNLIIILTFFLDPIGISWSHVTRITCKN